MSKIHPTSTGALLTSRLFFLRVWNLFERSRKQTYLWRILLGCLDFNFLTNGFSIKPLKDTRLAGQQKATG